VYLAWGLGSWSDGLYRSNEMGAPWTFDVVHWMPHTTSVVVPGWHPNLIVMGATDELTTGGIYISFDNGATWGQMNEGLESPDVLYLDASHSMAPLHGLYAGTELGVHVYDWDLYYWVQTGHAMPARCVQAYDPVYPDYAAIGWGSYSDGVYVSYDHGYTWDVLHWYIFPTFVYAHPLHSDYIFVGDSGYGVVFTPDGGTSWFDLNNGLENRIIRSFSSSASGPHHLYAGTDSGLYVHEFPPPRCGDANGDGVLTTGDAFFILNYFGAGPDPLYCWVANVDGNSHLSAADGFYLMGYFGGGPAPHCAYCDYPGPVNKLR
jgi:hypothetical protein